MSWRNQSVMFRTLLPSRRCWMVQSQICWRRSSRTLRPYMRRRTMGLSALVSYFHLQAIFSSLLALYESHFKQVEKTATLMSGFRQYIHYHIHSAKSYLHGRVRKRVYKMLRQLKESVFEEEGMKLYRGMKGDAKEVKMKEEEKLTDIIERKWERKSSLNQA